REPRPVRGRWDPPVHSPRAGARWARALGERVLRICLRSRLLSCRVRFSLRRVDLRDGRAGASESSSAEVARRAACPARLRAAVEVAPLRRSVALVPGKAVSITRPGAGTQCRAGGLGGLER